LATIDNWASEADVVVLGFGGAGAVTAISAHDAGAKVLIIEKAEGGGNTRLATLTFLCPLNSAEAKQHIQSLSFGRLDDTVIDEFLEWSSSNVEFVKELGGEVQVCPPGATFPTLPGSEAMIRYRVKGEKGEFGGASLWKLLSKGIENRRINILRHTTAKKLLRSVDEVIGVECEQAGKLIRIRSRKAVVLATGGFEYSETMKREHISGYPIFAYGDVGNKGDGIKMAQELGADLWHMNAVAAPLGYKFPEYDAAFIMEMPSYGVPNPPYSFIIVDQEGKRFCDETALEKYSMWMAVTRFDTAKLKYTRIPSFLIFDERTCLHGPITRVGHGANRSYQWTADNGAEIARGWIVSAEKPEELAHKLGIQPAKQLTTTLEAYSKNCQLGKDEEFSRSEKTLKNLTGNLYGVPVWPGLLNTQGGPRRNERGQILNVWQKPIPRLYGAGELGSIWGFLYQSGGNLRECLALGRMVGRNAAEEIPFRDLSS
jgi:succinate dehydrogenase/fumarate reductase flavoprotein subunit